MRFKKNSYRLTDLGRRATDPKMRVRILLGVKIERCPSGLRYFPAKEVKSQDSRKFESCPLCSKKRGTSSTVEQQTENLYIQVRLLGSP